MARMMVNRIRSAWAASLTVTVVGFLLAGHAVAEPFVGTLAGSGRLKPTPVNEGRKASINPLEMVAGPDGDLYFVDQTRSFGGIPIGRMIRKFSMATGRVEEVAGKAGANSTADGPAREVSVTPNGLRFGPDSNLYFLDSGSDAAFVGGSASRIRRVNLRTNLIETVAGTGHMRYNGDGVGKNINPSMFIFGPDSKIYFIDETADQQHRRKARIRSVDVRSSEVSTVAGTGNPSSQVVADGPALAVDIEPHRIRFGPDGNLYFTDAEYRLGWDGDGFGLIADPNLIRRVALAPGTVETLSGLRAHVIGLAGEIPRAELTELHPQEIEFSGSRIYFTELAGGRSRLRSFDPETRKVTSISEPQFGSILDAGWDGSLILRATDPGVPGARIEKYTPDTNTFQTIAGARTGRAFNGDHPAFVVNLLLPYNFVSMRDEVFFLDHGRIRVVTNRSEIDVRPLKHLAAERIFDEGGSAPHLADDLSQLVDTAGKTAALRSLKRLPSESVRQSEIRTELIRLVTLATQKARQKPRVGWANHYLWKQVGEACREAAQATDVNEDDLPMLEANASRLIASEANSIQTYAELVAGSKNSWSAGAFYDLSSKWRAISLARWTSPEVFEEMHKKLNHLFWNWEAHRAVDSILSEVLSAHPQGVKRERENVGDVEDQSSDVDEPSLKRGPNDL